MTALTKAKVRNTKGDGVIKSFPVNGGSTIYAGAIVMLDAQRYARPAAALASNGGCVGIALETVDNASGSDGDVEVKCWSGLVELPATSIAQAAVGGLVYASDDDTVDETQGSNEPKVGVLEEVVSSTKGWVRVGPAQITAAL